MTAAHFGNGNSSCRGSDVTELRRRFLERRLGFVFPLATSCLIGEPFALCADECAISAFQVINPERDPVVVPEIEFSGIAVQVSSH